MSDTLTYNPACKFISREIAACINLNIPLTRHSLPLKFYIVGSLKWKKFTNTAFMVYCTYHSVTVHDTVVPEQLGTPLVAIEISDVSLCTKNI